MIYNDNDTKKSNNTCLISLVTIAQKLTSFYFDRFSLIEFISILTDQFNSITYIFKIYQKYQSALIMIDYK